MGHLAVKDKPGEHQKLYVAVPVGIHQPLQLCVCFPSCHPLMEGPKLCIWGNTDSSAGYTLMLAPDWPPDVWFRLDSVSLRNSPFTSIPGFPVLYDHFYALDCIFSPPVLICSQGLKKLSKSKNTIYSLCAEFWCGLLRWSPHTLLFQFFQPHVQYTLYFPSFSVFNIGLNIGWVLCKVNYMV